MQVKRRINQFFGNILRKDKVAEEPDSVPQKQKKKSQKTKNNYSYSQWDLIENIAVDSGDASHCREDKMIYSDGLALPPLELYGDESYDPFSKVENTKPKSFLKRSSSLFRRSSRKPKNEQPSAQTKGLVFHSIEDGSLTNIVKELNETLIQVATFGGESQLNSDTLNESFPIVDTNSSSYKADLYEIHVESYADPNFDDEFEEEKKDGFKNGLRRQASKLASRFQRTPGSVRLKGAESSDSFPRSVVPKRSESFNVARSVEPTEMTMHQRVGSLKRKMSFKKARKGVQKVVVKGISSFGKTMMSASAVMPVAYECPPASYYPDYETDSPLDVQNHYYRTQSYQQRGRGYNWGDQAEFHGQSTRPTSFYQHGYCYNG